MLGQLNGSQNDMDRREMYDCPVRPDMEALTGALKLLTEKIDNLVTIYRDIVRWLLIVVCIIALGRSAIDLGRDFFKGSPAHAVEALGR